MSVWGYLVLCGACLGLPVWRCLELSGACLGLHGAYLVHLELSGAAWGCLGLSGAV